MVKLFKVLKNFSKEFQQFHRRVWVLGTALGLLALILWLRLIYLQVGQYPLYTTMARQNYVGLISLPPFRGLIFDRHGKLLADNKPEYHLVVSADQLNRPQINQLLINLRQFMTLEVNTPQQIEQQLHSRRRLDPIVLKSQLTEEEVARFSLCRYRFPEVRIQTAWKRYYPLGAPFATVVGYVDRVSEKARLEANYYSVRDRVGKGGVEQFYEQRLRGEQGYLQVEMNVRGKVLRKLQRKAPVSGEHIYLTIDAELQQEAGRLLGPSQAGIIIALDPRNGEVLTLLSNPSFDPNQLIQKSPKVYQKLQESLGQPLYNRAVQGRYPPGSIIKPFLGAGSLETGLSNFQMDVEDIVLSLSTFGYDQVSGIDLPGEREGLLPTRDWKYKRYGERWYPGDTLNLRMGQGFMLVTPLQMAVATGALAMLGQRWKPHVVLGWQSADTGQTSPTPLKSLPPIKMKPSVWSIIQQAMAKVVKEGTARPYFKDVSYELGVKTGTTQVSSFNAGQTNVSKSDKLRGHSLFIAFAPLHKPEIVLTIVLENSPVPAGYIARQLLDYYFKHREEIRVKSPIKVLL